MCCKHHWFDINYEHVAAVGGHFSVERNILRQVSPANTFLVFPQWCFPMLLAGEEINNLLVGRSNTDNSSHSRVGPVWMGDILPGFTINGFINTIIRPIASNCSVTYALAGNGNFRAAIIFSEIQNMLPGIPTVRAFK